MEVHALGRTRLVARLALGGAVAAVFALSVEAGPHDGAARPERDQLVIAHVPPRRGERASELERLRRQVEAAPRRLAPALSLARAEIEAARRAGDPRHLGAAEAALSAFTSQTDPPPEVRVLRAMILQSRHDFDAALRDLDRVLELVPDHAQAWLTRASVWTVKGGYEQARLSCERLSGAVSPALEVACRAPIDALTGRAALARAAIERALSRSRSPDEQAWLHSIAGEQAFWAGELERGARALKTALALDPADRYTRALYADLALERGDPAAALALVAENEADDALLLRAALAARALGRGDASARMERVREGFAASRLRGDAVHGREEARFWLVERQPARALSCALESWSNQREPWDARLVLEAALAAQQPERAAPVLAWLAETGFEAPRLWALADALRRGQPGGV